MKILYNPKHRLHDPRYEIFNGEKTNHQEIPDRIENIKKSLLSEGYKINYVQRSAPLSVLRKIHSEEYISSFKNLSKNRPKNNYIYPSVFNFTDKISKKYGNDFTTLGLISYDLYTPIYRHTYKVALNSANLAYELASEIILGKIKKGYALCRPPGHHAENSKMGGYCYFNNSSMAAEHLSAKGKVVILDIDFHHGNGTQQIFYQRSDVLTVSIHADPNWKFPFYSGFSDEKGAAEGMDRNINFPLQKGTTNLQYQATLEKALTKIELFKPNYLVIALGLDTHKDDPIGGFSLTTEYYSKMAKTINSLNLPTIIIQEGGYNTSKLGKNVVSFLNGFR